MKSLRKKLTFAVFCSLLVVFLLVLGLIDFAVGKYFQNEAGAMAELILNNGGVVPDSEEYKAYFSKKNSYKMVDIDDDSAYRTRYFLVHFDENGEIDSTDLDHVASVNKKVAEKMAESVVSEKKLSGYIDNYYYSISDDVVDDKKEDLSSDDSSATAGDTEESDVESAGDSKRVILFLDCSKELTAKKTVVLITSIIFAILISIVTIFFGFISGEIIRPFEENTRKQKQFITDASHELKTPLAIIQANADVLRYKDGDNSWLSNITDQTKQMGRLIGDLLALTKADEMGDDFVKERLNLIDILHETWDPFREAAAEKGIRMETNVPEMLMFNGNREMITKLFSILTDNAVKYASKGGVILFSMSCGKKNVILKMYNTADLPETFSCEHLFERFYRPDSSRSSDTGGHGIGLSIAKKLVDNHHGKIMAVKIQKLPQEASFAGLDKEKEGICFTVILPLNLK